MTATDGTLIDVVIAVPGRVPDGAPTAARLARLRSTSDRRLAPSA